MVAEGAWYAFIKRHSRNSSGPICMSARGAGGGRVLITVPSTPIAASYFPAIPGVSVVGRKQHSASRRNLAGQILYRYWDRVVVTALNRSQRTRHLLCQPQPTCAAGCTTPLRPTPPLPPGGLGTRKCPLISTRRRPERAGNRHAAWKHTPTAVPGIRSRRTGPPETGARVDQLTKPHSVQWPRSS
jgi:hypothetical protein